MGKKCLKLIATAGFPLKKQGMLVSWNVATILALNTFLHKSQNEQTQRRNVSQPIEEKNHVSHASMIPVVGQGEKKALLHVVPPPSLQPLIAQSSPALFLAQLANGLADYSTD